MDSDMERSADVALVLTRVYDEENRLEATELEIKSPYIKDAMRSVIKTYPGVNIQGDRNIVLLAEPRCLFHYRNELRDFALRSQNGNVAEHMSMCLTYMTRRFQKELFAFNNLMRTSFKEAGVDSEYIWMAFRPGMLIYSNKDGIERVYRLLNICKSRGQTPLHLTPFRGGWHLDVLRIESDGKTIGHVSDLLHIKAYDGYKPLRDLGCYPLEYYIDPDRVKKDLIARARKYLSLLGVHFQIYKGPKKLSSKPWRRRAETESTVMTGSTEKIERAHARNRVIIDCAYYHEEEETSAEFLDFESGEKLVAVNSDETPHFEDDELLIFTHLLPGFSLLTKRWDQYEVAKLDFVPFNEKAFTDMVLPEEKKRIIESLVRTETENLNIGNDLIISKGRGIVFLLHGPPGVGKTLMAEGIADYSHRPLYSINCSDLSQTPNIVEQKLEEALGLAKRWNAITLIDEADVFMEERSAKNLQRNDLVSVLLRRLESFEGVMFLTTNRVQAIDDAFMSRIHLSIAYPPLSPKMRSDIWKVFARQNLPAEEISQWLEEDLVNEISRSNVNGRQIKNAVRVAQALANNEERSLSADDIRSVLRTLQSFNDDMREQETRKRTREERGNTGGGASKRARPADDSDEDVDM